MSTGLDEGAPLVLVSNRGPVTYQEDGSVKRGSGGLVTALTGLASHRDAIWIASALTDTDVEVSEALWKGKAFIGGDVGGIPLQVQDGVTGYLVDSVEACAARALDIVADPELGRRLGRHGKEHVRTHFLTPRYLRDYLRIFSEVT